MNKFLYVFFAMFYFMSCSGDPLIATKNSVKTSNESALSPYAGKEFIITNAEIFMTFGAVGSVKNFDVEGLFFGTLKIDKEGYLTLFYKGEKTPNGMSDFFSRGATNDSGIFFDDSIDTIKSKNKIPNDGSLDNIEFPSDAPFMKPLPNHFKPNQNKSHKFIGKLDLNAKSQDIDTYIDNKVNDSVKLRFISK